MVCVGHTNSCPTHPGYDPPLGGAPWTDDPVDTNDTVKATHYNELKTYIATEYTRRGYSSSPSGSLPPTSVGSSDIIRAATGNSPWRFGLSDYLLGISKLAGAGTWPPRSSNTGYGSIAVGQDIEATTMNELRTETDNLRNECLCNCNYACTCVCNYCVCNCDHVCECNCNYSDERLKERIVYL